MKFIPLKDIIVVKREATKTEIAGFIIPESAQEKPNRGTVLSIGSGVKDVKVGNEVIFGKYDGKEQSIEGENVLLIRESAIWGVINA